MTLVPTPHPVRVKTSQGWQDISLIGPQGPQGPQGLQGPAGSSGEGGDVGYVFSQDMPSATWTITHNLNKYASVEVVDSGNSVITPDVYYASSNVIILTFGSETSGKAFLN